MKRALVVIPTTGDPYLKDAVLSVCRQTYENIDCLVVVDGPEYAAPTAEIVNAIIDSCAHTNKQRVYQLVLPWNTGAAGWNGHRIFAATPFLADQDYFFPLDQDNFYDTNHVETLIDYCEENGFSWCHSLRKICERDGTYVCDDNCESLGRYSPFSQTRPNLVDTSTYCIRRDAIIEMAPAWHFGSGADRHFYSFLSEFAPNFGCTGKHTVNYRVNGNPRSPGAEFFIEGNKIMFERYQGKFPWAS
jgi:glycosyltransferase involved in cell wall biosynthesis